MCLEILVSRNNIHSTYILHAVAERILVKNAMAALKLTSVEGILYLATF